MSLISWLSPKRRKRQSLEGAVRAEEDAYQEALADAELLLKFAAESGVEVAPADARLIVTASMTENRAELNAGTRALFYAAYTRLAKRFGDVTAESIRHCSSPDTRRKLHRDSSVAGCITVVVVLFSLMTFMANSMSEAMLKDIAAANSAAAALRYGLTDVPQRYADDPCKLLTDNPEPGTRSIKSINDIQELQRFAVTIRDILGRATKLNYLAWVECGPFDNKCQVPPVDPTVQNNYVQLNPALRNYTAEVLCKIKGYQLVRTFGTNVQADYAAIIGALTGYALPILYALLGAYAYRLRLFSKTVKDKTYHPSFSDTARMVTAVIAGAIAGLFNPAQDLALSPLATAFLIGYGVEMFFKFLDSLVAGFDSSSNAGRRPVEQFAQAAAELPPRETCVTLEPAAQPTPPTAAKTN